MYAIPDPPSKLRHKRRNILEFIVGLFIDSHVCQICGRKEIWSVSGWLQIDHPIYKPAKRELSCLLGMRKSKPRSVRKEYRLLSALANRSS